MKKFLVTGGLGFIGSNLIKSLRVDSKVVCVDDLSSARLDYKDITEKYSDVEFITECYSSDTILNRIEAHEFDGVFHIAAIPRVLYSVENPYKTTDINVSRTVKLLESCIKGSVKRVVFSSSSSVYGGADILPTSNSHPKDPKSPYAWQKSCIEDFIKIACNLYETDMVCLRYFNVFGPGQFGGSAYSTAVSAWCHSIKNKKPLRKDGTGEQSRDMCYIDNVISANILAMNSKNSFSGECFNVACGDRTSNNEILDFIKEKYENVEIVSAPFRRGDVMHTQADISETSAAIGYKPLVRFWDGLNKTLSWWDIDK